MKASYFEQHGGPDVLKYGERPDPVAGPGDVLVDIHASTVNGADWRVREGGYGPQKLPHICGRDFSGVVSAVGEGVTDLKVGDAVFAVMPPGQEGTYAEKVAVKAAVVAKKPDALSHVDAAPPWMRMVSPFFSFSVSSTELIAVSPISASAAASTCDSASGFFATTAAFTATFSA